MNSPQSRSACAFVRRLFTVSLLAVTFSTGNADDQLDSKQQKTTPVKTFGGLQYWGDVCWHQGWRIQQHVKTGHFRLLDDSDHRHESGTLAECRTALSKIRKEKKFKPLKGKAVIMIHGIVRSSKSFGSMEKRLTKEGYLAVGFDYPSTQKPLPELAEYLHKVIESLEGVDEINFVVHSMGGLLVRTYLMKHRDKRIRRMVMMGVPNKGAELADMLKGNPLFKLVMGPAGQQLVTDTSKLIGKLPTPKFEFGVIAGGRGNIRGYNPLIPGDDDGTVAVRSTRLPGATDFLLVSSLHSFLMANSVSMDSTVRYLKTGRFRANEPARPIEQPAPNTNK